jgi:hypothetical protein
MTRTKISPHQRLLIAARAVCSERSVKHAYEGRRMRSVTLTRIAAAARELGLGAPPNAPDAMPAMVVVEPSAA